jgi:hypothetical protein
MPVRHASAVRYPALQPIHHLIFDVFSRCKPSFSKCKSPFCLGHARYDSITWRSETVRFALITVDLAVAKSRDSDRSDRGQIPRSERNGKLVK